MRTADRRVVTPLHIRLMRVVAETNAVYGVADLRLEGGTALAAYYLVHRESEDLDFFADPSLNARDFGEAVRSQAEREGISIEPIGPASLGHARLLAKTGGPQGSAVRLDFAVSSPFHLEDPELVAEGIRVASYRDLCAGKLHAICDRFEERDFVDLHFILHGSQGGSPPDDAQLRSRFGPLVRDVMQVDPGLDPRIVGQSISRGVERSTVRDLPLRMLAPVAEEEIQATLRLCLRECARLTVDGIEAGRQTP